jgi:xylulose-5-phosphate/fructose-6-phosphate phosphoketolase
MMDIPTTAMRVPPELSAFGKARSTVRGAPLAADELRRMHAFWRACKYLALGMIFLRDNPLLREPLQAAHIKRRLLGHWGASPALAFAYTHLNRVIRNHDLDMIFMAGPGHGAPGVLAPVYLEGSYGEVYPDRSFDEDGLLRFFRQFSFPGGIGSHCTPETPGSIHEGGELGYVLSDRRRGGGRRRGRDGAARHVVARRQVPQPDP